MSRGGIVAAAVCVGLLAGCSPELDVQPWANPECPTSTSAPLALVLGMRQNSPPPRLPEGLEQLIVDAADAERPIVIVEVDGEPETSEVWFECPDCNSTTRRHELAEFVDHVVEQLSAVRAAEPEADPLTALSLGTRAVGEGGTVIMLDSGLQTTDPMDFTVDGMLEADPKEVADFLEETGLLPDVSGRAVVFGGLGEVADPQPALGGARAGLVDIWEEIADRGGATCTLVLDQPNTNGPLDGVPPVAVVDIPEVPTPTISLPEPPKTAKPDPEPACSQTVLRDAGDVKFEPDRSAFRDPKAARGHLKDLAEQMKAEGLRAELMGTTSSWGTEEGRLRLSKLRAEAVADVLIDLGVARKSLTATGVGTKWDGYIDDRGPANELLPGPAARNRAVVIRVGC